VRRALPFFLLLALPLAALPAACDEHFPAPVVADGGPDGALAPLEATPPSIVPQALRKDAASSSIVFDDLRGGVWTANGDVGTVSYVDVDQARSVIQEIAVGKDVRSVALSPDGAFLAAVDRAGAAVTLIDAETRAVLRTIPLGTHPRACVWDAADPRWLYVAVEDDAAVVVVDRTLGALDATIPVGRLPSGVAVSAERRELYVAHRIDPVLSVVDLHTRTDVTDVTLADEPLVDPKKPNGKPFAFESMAITADGRQAWLPHELIAPTHPFFFSRTLFPAISVVDLLARVEQQTQPNAAFNAIAGRKNLFDAINFFDQTGQPQPFSQICAVVMHPNGLAAWAIACGSEDLLAFDVNEGVATLHVDNLQGNHPSGLALDRFDADGGGGTTAKRLFVQSDQSHTLQTFDIGDGNPLRLPVEYGDPIPLVSKDPVDPGLRAGLTLFFRANSRKGDYATTGNDWMSCSGCHLDGFGSGNARLFEVLQPADPQRDGQIGHVGLVDLFSTSATPTDPSFDPHDTLVAVLDQGGFTQDRRGTGAPLVDPSHPPAAVATMAAQIAHVYARDLPQAPTWLRDDGTTPPVTGYDGAWCGQCHQTEYQAWSKSVHAHSADDPMVAFCVDVEKTSKGGQYPRLCAGCHDPVSARTGDVTFQAKRGVTCLGCHEVDREIRAGGNGDIAARAYDWTQNHKVAALASLDRLRQPEFCGGCHQQFIPGTGLVALSTLDEYHASPFAGTTRCVDCHAPRDANGVADHHFPGGNVYLGKMFGDDALVAAQMHNLQGAFVLEATRAGGGAWVTVHNRGAAHGFPTGVTDIREPWVEVQAKDARGNVLARIGGPGADGLLPPGAARLGIDIAKPDGTILYKHELSQTTRIPFDVRVPSGESQALFVPLPAQPPAGTTTLDAVLYYRNVRTTYYRDATGDPTAATPDVELARTQVP
jgi:hypothetical protein